MKSSLKIECIGDDQDYLIKIASAQITEAFNKNLSDAVIGKFPARYFVAEILGFHKKYKFERRFLKFNKDYSEANSKGSRGVYAHYILESDKIYDVKSPISWKYCERYFCSVSEFGFIYYLTEDEVIECLKSRLE